MSDSPFKTQLTALPQSLTRDIFTTVQGTPLHKSNFRRSTHWDELAGGHRLRDPRHTAATNWLQSDVPIRTVSNPAGPRKRSHDAGPHVYTRYLSSPGDARRIAAYNRVVPTQSPQDGTDPDSTEAPIHA
jgi:hypothetical protein